MIARVIASVIALAMGLGAPTLAHAAQVEMTSPFASPFSGPAAPPAPGNAEDAPDEQPAPEARPERTPTEAAPTEPGADAPPSDSDAPGERSDDDVQAEETPEAAVTNPKPSPKAPPPSSVRHVPTRVAVGVGLSPEAPGSKKERALLDRLERSLATSKDPIAELRHVSAGAGEPQLICRERRDDLVVMIGYLPERDDPVVLAHDCRLDRSLGVRSSAAVDEPDLLAALWSEHDDLVRQGVRERRTIRRLSPTARGIIIASVAVVVVGVAVGVLVANALRKERVVITVSP